MLNKLQTFLIGLSACLTAVSSCTSPVQELSAYWRDHDFKSLEGFEDIRKAEEKFDGYIDLLSKVPLNDAVKSLRTFLDSAAQDTIAYMLWTGWFEPYLHAPQSPYRNDALFINWLDNVLKDEVIDDGGLVEHLRHMRMVMDKNKVGSTLEDVCVTDTNGSEFMLSEFLKKKTLLLLVDANCPSCLTSLEENFKMHKNADLIAVLVGGQDFHVHNIRKQVAEKILDKWTLFCVSKYRLDDALYDTSILPVRLLVASDGEIIKSYH